METKRPTICLAMIVRNEAHIIQRCLESVKPWIDHWIVCDTGSVDNTCVATRSTMHGIPGKVYHHVWTDFGHNRSMALDLAKASGCEFTLVIDADEVLVVEDASVLQGLQNDAYRIEMRFPDISYPRVNFMRSARNFRYEGVIHEYATCTPVAPEYLLDTHKIHMWTDGVGARTRRGDKAQHDCDVLIQAVKDEPDNPRYWFYLAQAYETVNQPDLALSAYEERVAMGDYIAEVWYSHYRMAKVSIVLGNWDAATKHFLDAYECQPHRAEPLYWLAIGYHNKMQDNTALVYLEQATVLDTPQSDLFVEHNVYHHLRHMQYAVCLWNVGRRGEAREIAQLLLRENRVPEAEKPVIEQIAQLPAVTAETEPVG
jgi:glycosyltransferase involved in cell wall biosynthesis